MKLTIEELKVPIKEPIYLNQYTQLKIDISLLSGNVIRNGYYDVYMEIFQYVPINIIGQIKSEFYFSNADFTKNVATPSIMVLPYA